jgi:vacuolar-type H+-ATPase subunit D/Vma8
MEIIPERKLRTDKFLDILEKKSDQLMEVFKEILEDQKKLQWCCRH